MTRKILFVLVSALLVPSEGCRHAQRPQRPSSIRANAVIPIRCVTEARATNKLICVDAPNDPGWAICDGLAVKYECVQYKATKKEK